MEDKLLTGDCITHGLCSGYNIDDNNIEQNIDSENINFTSSEKNDIIQETTRKENMRVLSANALHLHEESVECITKSFPNLRQLELSYCFNGVTDKTIQMIFK